MVAIWQASGTYSHGFLILPAFLWLVWQRRIALSHLPTRPWWPGLLALVVLGLLWLLAQAAAANAPTQFAMVAMLPAATATVLGVHWVRGLCFPFVFLILAVPVGDSLIPIMMDWTADFTVASLKLSGVPVYREGNHFSIPSGDWSVVEACSGIRYVFACATSATLYAWTVYRSAMTRWSFVAVAIAISIAANWIRAYVIVMVAHFSNNQLATGIDHFVYGGVFFGVIMTILFSLARLWRENPTGDPVVPAPPSASVHRVGASLSAGKPLAAALAALAALAIWPLIALSTWSELHQSSVATLDIEPSGGWVVAAAPAAAWQPRVNNPLLVHRQTFRKDSHRVSVQLSIFGRPSATSKLASSANELVGSADARWKVLLQDSADPPHGGDVVSTSSNLLIARHSQVVVWHWYWVDGRTTTSRTFAALLQLRARVAGRSEAAAWVTVFATVDDSPTRTAVTLATFLSEMLGSIDTTLRAMSVRATAQAATHE